MLKDTNLLVKAGEVIVVCGPSGSGKSTLIRCINKLEPIQKGEIVVDGMSLADPATDLTKLRAEVGMVFQQFNLYPHMTALQNITLAPVKVRKQSREEAERIARDLLVKVGIPEKADQYPAQLSGGQQQRVAIARALAMQPKIMLFDEPTSALDPEMTPPRPAPRCRRSPARRRRRTRGRSRRTASCRGWRRARSGTSR